MRREVSDWLADGRYLLREALWRVYRPLTSRIPVLVTTRKAQAELERIAFELGQECERYHPRPPEPETPRVRHLRVV